MKRLAGALGCVDACAPHAHPHPATDPGAAPLPPHPRPPKKVHLLNTDGCLVAEATTKHPPMLIPPEPWSRYDTVRAFFGGGALGSLASAAALVCFGGWPPAPGRDP